MLPIPLAFEHPHTERQVKIGPWSYLWAGLLGALFVRWIGYGNVLRALAFNIVLGFIVLLAIGLTTYLPAAQQFLALAVLLPGAVYGQGVVMVSIVRTGFRRRGWIKL